MEGMFNQKLMDFVEDLSGLNQGLRTPVPQIDLLKGGVQLMASMDPSGPLRLFRKYVSYPYGPQIEARDDKFFLEASQLDQSHADDMDLIKLLRGVWKTLSTEDRDAIWGHMQLLLKIDQKISQVSGTSRR